MDFELGPGNKKSIFEMVSHILWAQTGPLWALEKFNLLRGLYYRFVGSASKELKKQREGVEAKLDEVERKKQELFQRQAALIEKTDLLHQHIESEADQAFRHMEYRAE